MNSDRVNRIVVMAIQPIKMIEPDLAEILTSHPTVAIRKFFDKHSGWGIVKMPTDRKFDDIHFLSRLPRLHPVAGPFRVVDFGPTIALPKIVREKVVLH